LSDLQPRATSGISTGKVCSAAAKPAAADTSRDNTHVPAYSALRVEIISRACAIQSTHPSYITEARRIPAAVNAASHQSVKGYKAVSGSF
jgi:hypothetical protein